MAHCCAPLLVSLCLAQTLLGVSTVAASDGGGAPALSAPRLAPGSAVVSVEPAPHTLDRLSIGAGFGVLNLGSGALAALGGASTSAPSSLPVGTALIEVALTRRLRAVLGASGGYSRSESTEFSEVLPTGEGEVSTIRRVPTTSTGWSYAGRAGLRWVLNPGGIVEVSPLLSMGFSQSKSTSERSDSGERGDGHRKGHGFDAQLGLVLERKLLDQLYLRFSSSVLQASRSRSSSYFTTETAGLVARNDATASAGLAFSPALELRLTF